MSTNATKRLSIALMVVGFGSAAAACGGGGDSADNDEPTVPADVVITGVNGIAWDAATYEATATDGVVAIEGRNRSSLPHNLYLVDSNGVEVSGKIDMPSNGSEDTFQFRLDAGEYTVICKIAGHDNMRATLTVK
jgi:plastocyanin